MEPRAGGRWRYVTRADDGREDAFRGVYHDVSPDRIVQTNEYERYPGEVTLETARLEERDGKTYMTAVSLASSVETRDAIVASGMEGGARELYNRLDEVIQRVAKKAQAVNA